MIGFFPDIFLQGPTSGVSGSESNVDHDVRKPLVCLLYFDGSNSPSFKGQPVASNTMQRKGLFSLGAPWNGDWSSQRNRYAREDSNPQPKVP